MSLSYSHTITTSLENEKLWNLIESALSGEDKGALWPRQYSQIKGNTEEGGIVEETVFRRKTIRYRIFDRIPGKQLRYSPLKDQGLVGTSSITVSALRSPKSGSPQGSQLYWQGTYQIPAWSVQFVAFRLYEALFFTHLRRKLSRMT